MERFEMRVPEDWLAAIDEWRNKQPIPPSRAAAIRYLVDAALRTPGPIPNAKPGSGSGGSAKPPSTGKTASRPPKATGSKPHSAPATSSQPLTKAEQLRALREQGAR